jgi:hypothetical protein
MGQSNHNRSHGRILGAFLPKKTDLVDDSLGNQPSAISSIPVVSIGILLGTGMNIRQLFDQTIPKAREASLSQPDISVDLHSMSDPLASIQSKLVSLLRSIYFLPMISSQFSVDCGFVNPHKVCDFRFVMSCLQKCINLSSLFTSKLRVGLS